MKYGGYVAGERLGGSAIATVWAAARPEHPGAQFAIKAQPPHGGSEHEPQALAFLAAARLQSLLGAERDAATRRTWAPMHAWGLVGTTPYYVTDRYPYSAQSMIALRVPLRAAGLTDIISACARGLRLVWDKYRRGHGRLTPSNVLLRGDPERDYWQAVLTDPAPAALPDDETALRQDLHALGALIHQLVTQQSEPPVPGTVAGFDPAWRALGRQGEAWLALRNRLLSLDVTRTMTIAGLVGQLPVSPRVRVGRSPQAAIGAAALAAVLLAVGGLLLWQQQQRTARAAQPLVALQAYWRDYRSWLGAFSRAPRLLPAAPPGAMEAPGAVDLPGAPAPWWRDPYWQRRYFARQQAHDLDPRHWAGAPGIEFDWAAFAEDPATGPALLARYPQAFSFSRQQAAQVSVDAELAETLRAGLQPSRPGAWPVLVEAQRLTTTLAQEQRWPVLAEQLRASLADLTLDERLPARLQALLAPVAALQAQDQRWTQQTFLAPLGDRDGRLRRRLQAYAQQQTAACLTTDDLRLVLDQIQRRAAELARYWDQYQSGLDLNGFANLERDEQHGLWAGTTAPSLADFSAWEDALPRYTPPPAPDPRLDRDQLAQWIAREGAVQAAVAAATDARLPDARVAGTLVAQALQHVAGQRAHLHDSLATTAWTQVHEAAVRQEVAAYEQALAAVERQADTWTATYPANPEEWLAFIHSPRRNLLAGVDGEYSRRWRDRRYALLVGASYDHVQRVTAAVLRAHPEVFTALAQEVEAWWQAFDQVDQLLAPVPPDLLPAQRQVLAPLRDQELAWAADHLADLRQVSAATWLQAANGDAWAARRSEFARLVNFARDTAALTARVDDAGLPGDPAARYPAAAWQSWRSTYGQPSLPRPLVAVPAVQVLANYDAVVAEQDPAALQAQAQDQSAPAPCQLIAIRRLLANRATNEADWLRHVLLQERARTLLASITDHVWRARLLEELRWARLADEAHLVATVYGVGDPLLKGLESTLTQQRAQPEFDLDQVLDMLLAGAQQLAREQQAGDLPPPDPAAGGAHPSMPGLAPYRAWLRARADFLRVSPDPRGDRRTWDAQFAHLNDLLLRDLPAGRRELWRKRRGELLEGVARLFQLRQVVKNAQVLQEQSASLSAALQQLTREIEQATPADAAPKAP